MIPAKIRVLAALSAEQRSVKELAKAIGSSYSRTAEVVKALVEEGFVSRANAQMRLADTIHAVLFRKLSRRHDMEKLLGDSREDVALALLQTEDLKGLQERTGLTYRTIRRALDKMMETGAVTEREGRYSLAEDEDLRLFLRAWKEQQERRLVEPYAEVAYASPEVVLKRVPCGKPAEGSLTAFSAFSVYGVELRPLYDYYVQPERKPTLEEVIVHAVVLSTSPVELTDCAVLLAKNLDRLDLGKARALARKLGVEAQLLDLESYVKNMTVTSPKGLLPWDEFAEKARMYGVDPTSLLPPDAFPDLFKLLSEQLEKPTTVYLFGGEAMRMRGLKRATKDVDVALEDEALFKLVEEALMRLGYRPLGGAEVTVADRRLEPSGIYVKEGYPRMDLFVRRICNAFLLSDSMKARAEPQLLGRLRLYAMSNEDLFLLKSVTEREGDIYDMIALAKAPGFNWRTVIDELYRQEERTGRHFCRRLLDSVEAIEGRAGIRAPFYHRLVNHCIDQAIHESVERWGATSLKQIRVLVNYPDYRLRNRIAKLVKEGKLAASGDGSYRVAG